MASYERLYLGESLADKSEIGYINSGKLPYKDESGFDLDSQVLVFKVTLPKGSDLL
jgi:hypothetical protein